MSKLRRRFRLKPTLEKILTSYSRAGAASLAGATALGAACGSPMRAEIIHTVAHLTFSTQNSPFIDIPVDLNNDGRMDFQLIGTYYPIVASFSYGFGNQLFESVAPPNRVAEDSKGYAEAFSFGANIGPHADFTTQGVLAGFGHRCQFGCNVRSVGEFINTKNKFLGIKFLIDGRMHYGWARINVQTKGNYITFEVVDYAYETVPNTPIVAGQGVGKSPANASATSVPPTLGVLAVGHRALPLWRLGGTDDE